jgi:S1-C subfamily serine protease
MKNSRSAFRTLLGAAILLVFLGTGCGLARILVTPTPEPPPPPATVAPLATAVPVTPAATATPAPGPVTPLKDEGTAFLALEEQVIAVHETGGPSVVNITNRSIVYDMYMQPMPQEGSGSGFVYDSEGHIVTNFHVIEGADQLEVTLANGRTYEAALVGQDPTNDLAVIRIEAGGDLPQPLPLGDSDNLRVGQFVVAIGNPFGLEQTLTVGVVSALGRIIQSPEEDRFIGEAIQTDAAITPGNSGGPLLDLQGRVIGVNSQIISPSRASAGIGFAVSSNTVRRVAPALIARGYYPHPWLGINSLPLSPRSAEILRDSGVDVAVDRGLLILNAVPGGPADQAGVQGGDRVMQFGRFRLPVGGDVLVAIDKQQLQTSRDLTMYLDTQTEIGQQVTLTLIRDGEELSIQATLGERPQE